MSPTDDFRSSLQPTSKPDSSDAIEGIIKAFDKFPIVALGEVHGLQEEADLITQLIRHPDFSAKVNDIVVEFGNALYQEIADGYVAGKEVPLTELRQVWRNTTQFFVWDKAIYEQFYVNVRTVNQSLPAARRLRVLLGDPPIDWNKVESSEDWWAFMTRDYDVKVVEKEVLSKNRKALYINGIANILEENGLLSLEQKYPQSIFIICPHTGGSYEKNAELESRLAPWSKPSLAMVKGTWLGELDSSVVGVLIWTSEGERPINPYEGMKLKDLADGYLYLGPADSLATSAAPPEIYRDVDYMNELKRRWILTHGQDPELITRMIPERYRDAFGIGLPMIDYSQELRRE
jgi:hypothetical protein